MNVVENAHDEVLTGLTKIFPGRKIRLLRPIGRRRVDLLVSVGAVHN